MDPPNFWFRASATILALQGDSELSNHNLLTVTTSSAACLILFE